MNRYKEANEGVHAPEEVKERAARPAGKRPYTKWMGAVAAVLAVAVIGGAAMRPRQEGGPAALSDDIPGEPPIGRSVADPAIMAPGSNGNIRPYALSMAAYPEMCAYPRDEDFFSDVGDGEDAWQKANDAYNEAYSAWRDSRKALRSGTDYAGLMDEFLSRSSAQFLTDAGEENRVYSPLNIYMALAMLAETTGGDSRQQILDLLQADSIEALRERAAALWGDNYRDDGVVTSILANSLWLRDGMSYSQEVLDTLAKDYYASSFSGEMGSEGYNQALRDWINEQTNGLLAEQAAGLEMNPDTVLALASTIYFKAAWNDEFSKENTETDTFHAPSGDVDVEFMRKSMESAFYWGDNFTAVQLSFQQGGSMWLVLPSEGYTVDELLDSGEAMGFLLSAKYDQYDGEGNVIQEGWTGQKYLTVNLSMPKFDVSSDLSLIGGLKELGVTDIFSGDTSDFGPLGASTDDPLYVSQAQHAARVKVDEEGCEAAAYTVIVAVAECAPIMEDEIDFVLDRPFLFAITGDSGLPLFVGNVNQPNG